jgi:hypothetical protein
LSFARLPLFCALFLLVRGLSVFLYRDVLPKPDLLPLALYSSSTLPLVVTIAHVGARTGEMLPENGAAAHWRGDRLHVGVSGHRARASAKRRAARDADHSERPSHPEELKAQLGILDHATPCNAHAHVADADAMGAMPLGVASRR